MLLYSPDIFLRIVHCQILLQAELPLNSAQILVSEAPENGTWIAIILFWLLFSISFPSNQSVGFQRSWLVFSLAVLWQCNATVYELPYPCFYYYEPENGTVFCGNYSYVISTEYWRVDAWYYWERFTEDGHKVEPFGRGYSYRLEQFLRKNPNRSYFIHWIFSKLSGFGFVMAFILVQGNLEEIDNSSVRTGMCCVFAVLTVAAAILKQEHWEQRRKIHTKFKRIVLPNFENVAFA